MRIDIKAYKEGVCQKCNKYTGDKLTFGKCIASKEDIYKCAEKGLIGNEKR